MKSEYDAGASGRSRSSCKAVSVDLKGGYEVVGVIANASGSLIPVIRKPVDPAAGGLDESKSASEPSISATSDELFNSSELFFRRSSEDLNISSGMSFQFSVSAFFFNAVFFFSLVLLLVSRAALTPCFLRAM